MPTMRAKLQIGFVQENFHGPDKSKSSETLNMHGVCRTNGYSDTGGLDEDNTFAMYSPCANLAISIANPELFDKFKVGDKFYVDFTPAD